MSTDWDQNDVVRAWIRTEEDASADRLLHAVFRQVEHTPQRRSGWIDRLPAANLSVGVAVAAVAAVVITAIAISALPGGFRLGGPPASGSPPQATSPASSPESAEVFGIPPAELTPSATTTADLVLRFDGNNTPPGTTLLVYDDGRLLLSRFNRTPEQPPAGYIGLTRQRLSPAGIEFLRSALLSTGLFEHDLVLAREGSTPFFMVELSTGGETVSVTWAWRGIAGDAPVATAEQERALRDLDALLVDPASWPASAWDDQTLEAYVPSQYVVCFGVRHPYAEPGDWVGAMDPAPIWGLLPEAAQDVLAAAEPTSADNAMHADAGCSRMTTGDARTLALILEDAGIHHQEPRDANEWLAFDLVDPANGDLVWMQFAPVLPDGSPIFLGPG